MKRQFVAALSIAGCGDDDNTTTAAQNPTPTATPSPTPPSPPALSPNQIDRMGRAGVNTALTNPFFDPAVPAGLLPRRAQ